MQKCNWSTIRNPSKFQHLAISQVIKYHDISYPHGQPCLSYTKHMGNVIMILKCHSYLLTHKHATWKDPTPTDNIRKIQVARNNAWLCLHMKQLEL